MTAAPQRRALARKAIYTVPELARAAGWLEKDGQPDGEKMARTLRNMGVTLRGHRPRTVLLADLHRAAPSFLASLDLAAAGD